MMAAPRLNWRLLDLLRGIAEGAVAALGRQPHLASVEITGLSSHSRAVHAGDLFLACVGQRVHGRGYIDAAIDAGAHAVLWEADTRLDSIALTWRTSPSGHQVPVIAVTDLSSLVGVLADRFYGQPSAQLFVTGITGTNGKTSCSQFLAQAASAFAPCGVIGTLGHGLYGALESDGHTTPDAVTCHRWLADFLSGGATSAVMEVSSHALDQGRVNGVAFDCAVFTNLTREHLDYHGDMTRYGMAKRTLFAVPGLRHAVINTDDAFGRELAGGMPPHVELITYGLEHDGTPPTVHGSDLVLDARGIALQVSTAWGKGELRAPLLGRFNASNLLAVLAVLLIRGVSLDEALQRLAATRTVSGRMERFGGGPAPLAVVDYAHTPDALEQVLGALREHCAGKLWCVFGCGGDRDRGKRPLMGAVAERIADRVVLTDDNPRHEDPSEIIVAIRTGMQRPDSALVQRERGKAIALALGEAATGDVVLIAGKGHEDYQLVGDRKLEFSDVATVQALLGEG
ncbi:MAG: UDP-N-acetylmuramoyl-L-alanyl-D-glutamate--2,6-diaminopimelate ligase [Pseudomonadota bacterium]|nr:MAG: UDP-N-acetylmuramoyl-L-alanyl-D-glutamate--2,6-diaminopimelate ligase [Pseudomonadota bacterium]